MKEELQIIIAYKLFLRDLIDCLEYIPRNEKYIKELLIKEAFSSLEIIYETNLMKLKVQKKNQILSKLSIIDFYFEYFYSKKEISKKIVMRKSHELEVITKMVKVWLK